MDRTNATWGVREQRILEAVEALENATRGPRWETVADTSGLPRGDVQLGLRRLYDAGFVGGIDVTTNDQGGFELLDIRLLERGLRATGTWPEDSYTELVAALDRAIGRERDPTRRSGLERLRDEAVALGRGVLESLLSDYVKRVTGL